MFHQSQVGVLLKVLLMWVTSAVCMCEEDFTYTIHSTSISYVYNI